MIQDQIKRIPIYIKEVIRLEGGNEYKERRRKGQKKNRVYQNKKYIEPTTYNMKNFIDYISIIKNIYLNYIIDVKTT